MTIEELICEKLPIPEYYKRFVNASVDLNEINSMPCEFHKEEHGKSFTITRDKKKWRCWGECHCGGNTIDLHKHNRKLKTREEAIESLKTILNIENVVLEFTKREVKTDEQKIEYAKVYNKAIVSVGKDINLYLELDYIISQHKSYKELIEDLNAFIVKSTYKEV